MSEIATKLRRHQVMAMDGGKIGWRYTHSAWPPAPGQHLPSGQFHMPEKGKPG
jgi:hypothetical protein